jgi:hypothetical protein
VPKAIDEPPFFVYCSKDGGATWVEAHAQRVQRDSATTDIYHLDVALQPGDDIRCDWYSLPTGTPSPSPTPQPTQPVTQLPNTGAGLGGADAEGGGSAVSDGLGLIGVVGRIGLARVVSGRRPRWLPGGRRGD